MFVKQLSVFLENREGRLEEVLKILKENEINIVSLSLADTSDFGLLRMLVSDPEAARAALKAKGISAKVNDIVAIQLSHKIGKLEEVLSTIYNAEINIEYMYALSTGRDGASIAIKTSDLEKTVEVLKKADVKFYTPDDMANI